MSHLIWIDTSSGTWGGTVESNGSLVLIETSKVMIDYLESASDSQIAEYGLRFGSQPMIRPCGGELYKILYALGDQVTNFDQLVSAKDDSDWRKACLKLSAEYQALCNKIKHLIEVS